MIKLDEIFSIVPDTYCWVLLKEEPTGKKNDKGIEIISRDRWYCADLEAVFKRYRNESCKYAESVEQLQEIIEESNQKIEKCAMQFKKVLTQN